MRCAPAAHAGPARCRAATQPCAGAGGSGAGARRLRTGRAAADAAAPPQPADIGPNGKAIGDTQGLSQFETGRRVRAAAGGERVSFSLEDADLPELVRVIGELTGKRFIFGGQGPQHQGHRLLAAEGDGRRGVPGVPLDPRGERPDRRPARALLQDRRLARREDGRAGRTSPVRRPRGEDRYITRIHRASQRQRRGGRQRPRALQVEGRRHRRLRPRQPAHHHGHRAPTSSA